MSAEEIVAAWVARAEALAEAKRHAVTNEAHVLRVMLDDDRIRDVVARCEVDTGRFAKMVDDLVDAQRRRSWLTRDRARTLLRVESSRSALVDEVLFVRALESKVAAPLLEKLVEDTAFSHVFDHDECTDEDAIHARSLPLRAKLVASHGSWREPPLAPMASPAIVVVHDDPFTTMEFVTRTLHEVFDLGSTDAEAMMLRVHEHGRASLEAVAPSKAIARVRSATSRARAQGFPLRLTIEPI